MKSPLDDLLRVGGQAVSNAIGDVIGWGEEKLKGSSDQPVKPKPDGENLETLIRLCRQLCQKNRAYLDLFQQIMSEPENRHLLDRMEESIPDGKAGLEVWMTQMAELEKSLIDVDYDKVFPKTHLKTLEQRVIDLIEGAFCQGEIGLDSRWEDFDADDWGMGYGHMRDLFEDEFNLTDDQLDNIDKIFEEQGSVRDIVLFIKNIQSKKDQRKGETNALRVIAPYRWGGTWVFDDPAVGLNKEPFVAGIPEMIDLLLTRKGMKNADRFRLTFSAYEFPGYDEKIVMKSGQANQETYYESQTFGKIGRFYAALAHYFDESPKQIYVRFDTYPD